MMPRLFVLNNDVIRERVAQQVLTAAPGTRVTFAEAKRTDAQNSKLHAMISDIAKEMRKRGKDFEPEQWKVMFMHACGQEVQFVPSLDGRTFIPFGTSSSRLSIRQMSDLIEFINAWAAENTVTLVDLREDGR